MLSQFENVITILPITYFKTKMPGKNSKCLVYFMKSGKLYQLYKNYLSIIFGGTF